MMQLNFHTESPRATYVPGKYEIWIIPFGGDNTNYHALYPASFITYTTRNIVCQPPLGYLTPDDFEKLLMINQNNDVPSQTLLTLHVQS